MWCGGPMEGGTFLEWESHRCEQPTQRRRYEIPQTLHRDVITGFLEPCSSLPSDVIMGFPRPDRLYLLPDIGVRFPRSCGSLHRDITMGFLRPCRFTLHTDVIMMIPRSCRFPLLRNVTTGFLRPDRLHLPSDVGMGFLGPDRSASLSGTREKDSPYPQT